MSHFIKPLLSLAILIVTVIAFTHCNDDGPNKAPEQIQLDKLKKTWTIVTSGGATLDATDRTADFSGFTLTIGGTFNSSNPKGPYTFSVSGTRPTPSPWPASGNWFFGGDPESQLIRDENNSGTQDSGDLSMTYFIDSTGKLNLTFTCTSCNYAGSRVSLVNGTWNFILQ
ncbi:MAG: hypothetical protein HRU69_09635 [Flammeovirgaceae bacterium]|nr:MAG: hypothetical protein HRU69_09635 [Flammeovirgaceae bacterium]